MHACVHGWNDDDNSKNRNDLVLKCEILANETLKAAAMSVHSIIYEAIRKEIKIKKLYT